MQKQVQHSLKDLRGQSIIEIVIALAIFSLIAASMVSLAVGGFVSLDQGGEHTQAEALAQEGFEAVRSIRDNAWNTNTFTTSSVSISGDKWVFDGEATTETIGKYTRTISFENVCRDGSDDITFCPGSYTDLHTKLATVKVSWSPRIGVVNEVERVGYITNWDSREWVQTDWVGGNGQTLWSDATKFDFDNGSIDYATAGQITLSEISGYATGTWPFTTSSYYTFDSDFIEVTGGVAQLVATSGGVAEIDGTEIGNYEYDTQSGRYSEIIHISGDVYAVVHRGDDSDGFVRTFEIDTAGNITVPEIDSLEFHTTNIIWPKIKQVNGNIYAIVYEGNNAEGIIATVTIETDGTIGNAVIDKNEYDATAGKDPDIAVVNTGIIAVVSEGRFGDGFLDTFTIDGAGNISNSAVDTLEFDSQDGEEARIIHVSGDIFAIAYKGKHSDGFLKTVNIDSSGNIDNSIIDSFEFDTVNGEDPEIFLIDGSIFGILYRGDATEGYLKTLSIDGAGTIGAVINTFEFDTVAAMNPDIAWVTSNQYAIAYSGGGNNGEVSLVTIETDGQIGDAVTDNQVFDGANGDEVSIVRLDADTFVISYDGKNNDGYLTTWGITTSDETYSTDIPTISPTSSASATGLILYSAFIETATKNGGEIYYQLSYDDGSSWYYWDGGAWAVAGLTDYNVASVINTNISTFTTTTATITFQANVESDGLQQVQLDNVAIGWSTTDVISGYETSGVLTSSAFDMGDSSPVQIIDWDEILPSCSPSCTVKFELSTAPDADGSPGTWTSWYGASGAGTFFTASTGALISTKDLVIQLLHTTSRKRTLMR